MYKSYVCVCVFVDNYKYAQAFNELDDNLPKTFIQINFQQQNLALVQRQSMYYLPVIK